MHTRSRREKETGVDREREREREKHAIMTIGCFHYWNIKGNT